MTLFHRRPGLRWLVPVVVALLLATAGSVVGLVTANARDPLPPRTAAQLLADVQRARLEGLSGTIVQNADLGLPSLPGAGGSGSSDLTSLVSGSHTLRLWYAGPDRVRLALLGSLGESDVVRNGTDLWVWSSKDRTATHRTVPAGAGRGHAGRDHRVPGQGPAMTPQQAADAALAALSPTTAVSTDGTAVVAGRSAYELLLQPRDRSSLVESVRIAVDSATHVPTRVQVFARNASDPAFEVGFTRFDPTTPESSMFRFAPPPGTKVTEGGSGHATPSPRAPGQTAPRSGEKPVVVGRGWTSVAVTKVPTGSLARSGALSTMLSSLPKVHGAWGSGRLLQGSLFSAVLTDDGRLAVGAVSPDRLYAALARR